MKWFTKDGKLSNYMRNVLELAFSDSLLERETLKPKTRYRIRAIIGGHYSKGWITGARNYKHEIQEILDFFGVPYTTGNDAPKGGKHGDYFEISLNDAINLQAIYMLFK